QFDTLSVYRGSLCEHVAGIRITRSTTRQRLSQHETSNNPEIQPSRSRKTSRSQSHSDPITRINSIDSINSINPTLIPHANAPTLQRLPARQAQSSLVKPDKAKKKYFDVQFPRPDHEPCNSGTFVCSDFLIV